jgi:hypothetical protein
MGDMTCLLPDQELPFGGHELSELPLDRSICKEYFEHYEPLLNDLLLRHISGH